MSRERASPVCYAAQADDVYMGYAGADELLASLNELLEAERAGARVALGTKREASYSRLRDLMRKVHRDEARWCAMLSKQVKRLSGTPSRKCGAFRGKAMAIPDPLDRLAFLNRGQAWVVRKLEALLSRVRDDDLHAALAEMLRSHVENIAEADAVLRQLRRTAD
jgi:hypothetical protein